MRTSHPPLTGLAALGALALALAGCSSSGGDAATSAPPSSEAPVTSAATTGVPDGGTLVMGLYQDTEVIDPQLTNNSTTLAITRMVVDSLIAQNDDMSYSPWLAESWDVNADNTVYTFTLREDVTFSDGAPFNAEAVKANLDRILDPETNATYAKSLLGSVSSVEVVDEFTVRITCAEPNVTILQSLSQQSLGMESPQYLASGDVSPANVVGSGPFTLEKFTPGEGVTLKKRADYAWNPGWAENEGAAHFDAIEFQILKEDSVREGALTSAQAQIIDGVAPTSVATLGANADVVVDRYDYPGITNVLFFNTQRAPFDDLLVRQAFMSAFDADAVSQAAWLGTVTSADNLLSPTTNYYDPSVGALWGYDLDKANALLDEAGWTEKDGDGFRTKDGQKLTVTFVVSNARPAQDRTLAQAIQDQVKAAGIDLVLDMVESGVATERENALDFDIFQRYAIRPEADILRTYLLSQFIPPNGTNDSSMSALDAQLTEAAGADDATRQSLYSEVQTYFIEQAYGVPTYVPAARIAYSAKLHGVRWGTTGKVEFYDAWLEA
jgi:peptide/nickel transport system substrate-binding protein